MEEALAIFESLVNSEKWWKESKIILCFTRYDIFEEKIKSGRRPLAGWFPGYMGPLTDVDACREYITTRFTDLIRNRNGMDILYVNMIDSGHVRQMVNMLLGEYDPRHHATCTSSSGFTRYYWERELNTGTEALWI